MEYSYLQSEHSGGTVRTEIEVQLLTLLSLPVCLLIILLIIFFNLYLHVSEGVPVRKKDEILD